MSEQTGAHSRRGKPKGDKRDRTRAKLLETARMLIREKGHEHATLEDIAERAGMTTGAIYGNFKNRNDLFIALAETYWAPIKPKVKPGSSFVQVMHAIAEATIEVMPDREAAGYGRMSGIAYTLANKDLHARVREVTAQNYAFGAEWLRSVTKKGELPMPAEKLIAIVHSLSEGLVIQRLLTPELITNDVIRAAFKALAARA